MEEAVSERRAGRGLPGLGRRGLFPGAAVGLLPVAGSGPRLVPPALCPGRCLSQVTAGQLRERGNALFHAGDHAAALAAYTEALSLCDAEPDRTVLHRNRAACYLKLVRAGRGRHRGACRNLPGRPGLPGLCCWRCPDRSTLAGCMPALGGPLSRQDDYAKAEAHASKAIEADGRDMKALFRRSQALQKLGRLGQAVSDLQRCVSLEPKNKALQEALRALGSSMHEKMKTMSCTDSKVEQMFQILLDCEEKDVGKRSELWGAEGGAAGRSLSQAAQNLIVLAQEEAGAEKIFQSDGVQLLTQLLDTAKADLLLAALRPLVGLCSGHRSRTTAILAELGSPRLSAVLGVEHEQVSLAACNLLHVMFDSLKEGLQKDFCGKKDAVVLDTSKDLKMLIKDLLDLLVLEGASAHGRDNALNLLIEVVPRKSPKETNNSMSLWVIDQGLKKILEVGSAVCGAPGSLPVTENSWMSASVLLSKLYDDLKCNAERENFHHLCEDYVRHVQLGHGTLPSELQPRLVEALASVPMQTVTAGGWHSASVSGDAEPRSPQEQPAAEDAAFVSIQAFPALLDLPQELEVSAVSCGSRHTAVVTRGGELYTWGWGK
ncbi:protein unc-45 homolog A-like [Podargus strigoides]